VIGIERSAPRGARLIGSVATCCKPSPFHHGIKLTDATTLTSARASRNRSLVPCGGRPPSRHLLAQLPVSPRVASTTIQCAEHHHSFSARRSRHPPPAMLPANGGTNPSFRPVTGAASRAGAASERQSFDRLVLEQCTCTPPPSAGMTAWLLVFERRPATSRRAPSLTNKGTMFPSRIVRRETSSTASNIDRDQELCTAPIAFHQPGAARLHPQHTASALQGMWAARTLELSSGVRPARRKRQHVRLSGIVRAVHADFAIINIQSVKACFLIRGEVEPVVWCAARGYPRGRCPFLAFCRISPRADRARPPKWVPNHRALVAASSNRRRVYRRTAHMIDHIARHAGIVGRNKRSAKVSKSPLRYLRR